MGRAGTSCQKLALATVRMAMGSPPCEKRHETRVRDLHFPARLGRAGFSVPVAAPYAVKPADDGLNGKLGAAFGGTNADGSGWEGMGGAFGVLSVPLGHAFGLQLDATAGLLSGKFAGEGAALLFWRDPGRGLVGVCASAFDSSHGDMPYLAQGAGEAHLYLGRSILAGSRSAASSACRSSNRTTSRGLSPSTSRNSSTGSRSPGARPTISCCRSGHAYSFKKHAVTLQAEHLLSVFAEGFAGESRSYGALAGVKVYFGQSDKTLIRRHREDDPPPTVRTISPAC